MNRFASITAAACAVVAVFALANATMNDARSSAIAMVNAAQIHQV